MDDAKFDKLYKFPPRAIVCSRRGTFDAEVAQGERQVVVGTGFQTRAQAQIFADKKAQLVWDDMQAAATSNLSQYKDAQP